jgi:hypothetical protein
MRRISRDQSLETYWKLIQSRWHQERKLKIMISLFAPPRQTKIRLLSLLNKAKPKQNRTKSGQFKLPIWKSCIKILLWKNHVNCLLFTYQNKMKKEFLTSQCNLNSEISELYFKPVYNSKAFCKISLWKFYSNALT